MKRVAECPIFRELMIPENTLDYVCRKAEMDYP
jgi:hypothetical protein